MIRRSKLVSILLLTMVLSIGFAFTVNKDGERITNFKEFVAFQKAGNYDLATDLFTEETWKEESSLGIAVNPEGAGSMTLTVEGKGTTMEFTKCIRYPQFYVFSLTSGKEAKLITLSSGDIWGFSFPTTGSLAKLYFKDE